MIRIKRAYDPPGRDGYRVLVDRLWPRGVKKEEARIDEWIKDAAPSDDLRKWFGHDPEKWNAFRERYARELDRKGEAIDHLREKSAGRLLTLVYGARDERRNNAVALKEYLESR